MRAFKTFQASGDAKFSGVVRDIVEYVTRDLKHPLGGFFSGEDADSLPTAEAEKKLGCQINYLTGVFCLAEQSLNAWLDRSCNILDLFDNYNY